MALSAEQILVIRNYVTELQRINPSGWVKDLTSAMDQFDVSPSMLQEAYSDISVSEIQSAYNQSNPTGKFSTSRPQPQPQPQPQPKPEPQPQPASAVDNIKRQLRAQYDAVVAQQPQLKYKFEDRLDRIFEGQAQMLADAGITDITQVGRKFEYLGGEGALPPRNYSGGFGGTNVGMEWLPVSLGSSYLIDKRTGKKLELDKSYEGNFQIQPEVYENIPNLIANTPADQVKTPNIQYWGRAQLGSGIDIFNVVFNDQDQPVFIPTWSPGREGSFKDFIIASAKFLLPFYIPVLGEALHSTAFGQAIGATASNVLAGGATGAIIADAAGGDPLKGLC
jgi:hypothetical protein